MFNRYYQEELQNLRERAREFSAVHPAAAPMLGGQSSDPDVERLLEGVAFLTGLLRRKLDDELPEVIRGACGCGLSTLPETDPVRFRGLLRPQARAPGDPSGPGGHHPRQQAGGGRDLSLPDLLRPGCPSPSHHRGRGRSKARRAGVGPVGDGVHGAAPLRVEARTSLVLPDRRARPGRRPLLPADALPSEHHDHSAGGRLTLHPAGPEPSTRGL